MKMNSFFKKWSLLTFVAAATTLGCLSCSDKYQERVEPPVVETVVHSISGMVLTPAEAAIGGAKLVVAIDGKTLEATTDAQGKFALEDLATAGTYAFVFTADGRIDATAEVVIADDKKSHNESITVVMDKKPVEQEVTEEVKVEHTTDEDAQKAADEATQQENATEDAKADLANVTKEQIVQTKEEVKVEATTEVATEDAEAAVKVEVAIPAQTVMYVKDDAGKVVEAPKDLAISIAPVANVASAEDNTATSPAAAPAVATVVCGPDGLHFATPIELTVANPMGDESFEGASLYYLNPKTNLWEKETAEVKLTENGYKTEVTHFSAYSVKLPGITPKITDATEKLSVEGVDNTTGSKTLTKVEIPYSIKQGVEVSDIKAACTAQGLSDISFRMIKNIVANRMGATTVSTEEKTYKTGMDLLVGQGIRVVSASQTVTGYTWNFKVVTLSGVKTVTVTAKKYGAASIQVQGYSRDHTGGSN